MLDEVESLLSKPIDIELSHRQRQAVDRALSQWFESTDKSQVSDLGVRVAAFKKRLQSLSKNVRLQIKLGKEKVLVAIAEGEDLETLKAVENGTLWFDGWNSVPQRLMAVAEDA